MNILDVFSDDAFSLDALTASLNNKGHVPGRAGEVVFTKLGTDESKGVPTISVSVEMQGEALTLIPTTPRGGVAPRETADKRTLRGFNIPQIKLEDTIYASEIQNVRAFGESPHMARLDPMTAVQAQLTKMARRHDLTLEHHRLGALKGVITDADGSVLLDLYQAFDIENSLGLAAPETFDFNLDDYTTPGVAQEVRVTCQKLSRHMARRAKMDVSKALVWAFCGDSFFDKLISHPNVKKTYNGTEAAKQALGDNYAFGVFEFGGIFFENYRGTDDMTTVAIADDEARFFFTGEGAAGIYGEYFAPADFLETVNTPGLPRYAKLAVDPRFNQFVELHTQANPLPICLRPQTLVCGVISED